MVFTSSAHTYIAELCSLGLQKQVLSRNSQHSQIHLQLSRTKCCALVYSGHHNQGTRTITGGGPLTCEISASQLPPMWLWASPGNSSPGLLLEIHHHPPLPTGSLRMSPLQSCSQCPQMTPAERTLTPSGTRILISYGNGFLLSPNSLAVSGLSICSRHSFCWPRDQASQAFSPSPSHP